MTGKSEGAPTPCDLLIVNGYLLTLDGARRVYGDGALAIRGEHIAAVGPTPDIERAFSATRRIDAKGAVVHPGFIDGHYHSGLHLSRGSITDDPNPPKEEGGPGPGVFTRWTNALTEEDEYASALMASVELLGNGFTGFVDAATTSTPTWWPARWMRWASAVRLPTACCGTRSVVSRWRRK
jgi:5-methylthioadenosine/S-adenosylhomocysteine deaminase